MCDEQCGMSLRQYAAIKLCVPQSGTPWLDDMIRESRRNSVAEHALIGVIQSSGWEPIGCEDGMTPVSEVAYSIADAMIAAGSRPGEAP